MEGLPGLDLSLVEVLPGLNLSLVEYLPRSSLLRWNACSEIVPTNLHQPPSPRDVTTLHDVTHCMTSLRIYDVTDIVLTQISTLQH